VRQTKGLKAKIREGEEKIAKLSLLATAASTPQQARNIGGFGHSRTNSGRSIPSSSSSSYPATVGVSGISGSGEAGMAERVAEMLEQVERLEGLRGEVEELEDEVRKYGGLPAEKEAARREVGKLEVELDGWRRGREGVFEGLV